MQQLTSDTILNSFGLNFKGFSSKWLQKDKENPSQFDVAIRPATDQLQSLEMQISSHIPMRQRIPPKARETKKSSSEAQSGSLQVKKS